jgi:aldose sugar dehydrogenase
MRLMKLDLRLIFAMICAATCTTSAAQEFSSEKARFRVVTVASGLGNPWALAFLPDGRMLVTERAGRMRIVARDGTLSAPLSGVPPVVAQGQGGLLDVVPDREFTSNRTIYFCFSEAGEGGAGSAVARARLDDRAITEVRVVFRQQPKVRGGLHFGCRIVINREGLLYVTLGERYQRDRAQDLSTHMGKVIRIRGDGSVPPDNPFVDRAGVLPEIWSYGHRNPQGAALHPQSGAPWLHEHGARGGDEINIPEAGKNYGWPVITHGIDYSGAPIGIGKSAPGMEPPRYFWVPSIAPSGMAFYTGDAFPAWKGSLFVGALAGQRLLRLELEGSGVKHEERLLGDLGERIRDVRSGPDGLIYLLTDSANGRLLRLEPTR